MANYEGARVKLTNPQLNKLKSAAKNKTGTTLITTKQNVQDEESFPTTEQNAKIEIHSSQSK